MIYQEQVKPKANLILQQDKFYIRVGMILEIIQLIYYPSQQSLVLKFPGLLLGQSNQEQGILSGFEQTSFLILKVKPSPTLQLIIIYLNKPIQRLNKNTQ
ncbi:hypothetical protein TTHERM_000424459 (macronuclear) [Tetrahymena thermophila SB210]|uniref:Uncharacterized protein n=1 Tax=Tetrahymena thermophila (strain SB210) TaxID=312017 RepID=W7XIV5_TETTS|nr:hypothetical protein TTHERM_000424459 [Tetrahymena thermophila SB210]EWS74956.1 hypothetical protein TTHERM_000424459 [Tetrahymena thermophila SB210]|eukprot:XP_012652497.1 hypothetical protein TTHERM_000424459 [Tetrahymena thermophila SB210]